VLGWVYKSWKGREGKVRGMMLRREEEGGSGKVYDKNIRTLIDRYWRRGKVLVYIVHTGTCSPRNCG